ncbi:MAG: type VI secretion system ATPase TssH, partial [Gemmatimonadetes bacterium]|nr:type VI secretion system ATPase TssH [Gemmatimonadota bacterium]
KPLTLAEIEEIVELLIAELRQRLAAKRIELVVATPARRHIAHAGFDPVYGARPLKRFLQRELETRIARLLVAGDMPEGSRVEVVLDEGQLAVRHQPSKAGTDS